MTQLHHPVWFTDMLFQLMNATLNSLLINITNLYNVSFSDLLTCMHLYCPSINDTNEYIFKVWWDKRTQFVNNKIYVSKKRIKLCQCKISCSTCMAMYEENKTKIKPDLSFHFQTRLHSFHISCSSQICESVLLYYPLIVYYSLFLQI